MINGVFEQINFFPPSVAPFWPKPEAISFLFCSGKVIWRGAHDLLIWMSYVSAKKIKFVDTLGDFLVIPVWRYLRSLQTRYCWTGFIFDRLAVRQHFTTFSRETRSLWESDNRQHSGNQERAGWAAEVLPPAQSTAEKQLSPPVSAPAPPWPEWPRLPSDVCLYLQYGVFGVLHKQSSFYLTLGLWDKHK